MIARPGQFPDWDDNDTDVTQPPASYVSDGAPAADPVWRQYLNWMFSRIGRWIRRLDQETIRPAEIFGNHQTPAGVSFVANLTGSTLVQPAGHFTTRAVYANGIRVAPTDAPARTYTASRDTYWDLDEDGVLYATEVPVSDPAPAIAAGRTRVALAVSDGTSVTSVAAFPIESHKRLAGRFTVPVTGLTYELSSNRGVIADGGDLGPFDPSGLVSIGRQIIQTSTAGYDNGAGLNQPAAAGGHTFYKVLNARVNIALNTVARETTAADSYMYVFGARGFEILYRAAGLSDSWTNVIDAVTGWTRLLGFSDAGTTEDFAVGGDVVADGDYTYAAAQTRTLTLFGREGQFLDDGSFTQGLSEIPTSTNLLLNYTGSGPANVVYPVHLPDGAVITGVDLVGSIGATGARVWLQRRSVSGATTQSLNAGSPDYDVIASTASGSVNPLTINASSGIRTVDHSDYHYAVVVHFPTGSTGTIEAIQITYTVTQAS